MWKLFCLAAYRLWSGTEDWKVEVEEGLRAGVDVREGVDGSPQECHIASMRKFANELLDQGFLEPDSPRRTRRGSVFA